MATDLKLKRSIDFTKFCHIKFLIRSMKYINFHIIIIIFISSYETILYKKAIEYYNYSVVNLLYLKWWKKVTLKSLVWPATGWIRTQNLLISERTIYHYATESVNIGYTRSVGVELNQTRDWTYFIKRFKIFLYAWYLIFFLILSSFIWFNNLVFIIKIKPGYHLSNFKKLGFIPRGFKTA